MTVWVIGDLHLSFGVPNKEMDVFGKQWERHTERVEENWRRQIKDEDLVLIPGDISWALHPDQAIPDLQWIHSLPGKKVLIKGNHDYWWTSISNVRKIAPPSLYFIQNDTFTWNHIQIAGSRLWDTDEYDFDAFVPYIENPHAKKLTEREQDPEKNQKIFNRELIRLENSLKLLKDNDLRIAMTHYPPIGPNMEDSKTSLLLEKYHVDICVFGHIHNLDPNTKLFGNKNGIKYILSSCDYLNCNPLRVK